jgi:hypothetical protein
LKYSVENGVKVNISDDKRVDDVGWRMHASMDSKLNTTLGKRLSGRQPKRLPKQITLPSKVQIKQVFLDVESNQFSQIELPFGDPPEYYLLVAMRDRLKGTCQWNLYRGEGDQSALEWTVNGNDWEQIYGRISALFPGWDLKTRTLVTENTSSTNLKAANDPGFDSGKESTFFRTLEGDLRNLQVPNLLQAISMGKLTGRLQIQSHNDTAQMFFNDGAAVHCKLKGAEGDAAVVQLVGWEEGKFCFFPEPKTDLKTINKRLDSLIMEGAQFVDQFKSLNGKGLSFDAVVSRVHESITEEEFEKLLAAGTGIDVASQKKFYVAIDNRSTLFEILRMQQLSQVQWVPILFNLVSCGLIEFSHPEALPKAEPVYKGSKVEWGQMQLAEKALTMPDTGLYTFPAFLYFLDREYCRFERFQRPFSLVVLKIGILPRNAPPDADSSKLRPLPITAVKDLGKTVTRIKRQIDILAHYQTFDYALLLPETGKQSIGNFVDRLSEVLRVTNLQDIGSDEIIDFAIGYASLPEDGNNLDLIISLAWSRLYNKS